MVFGPVSILGTPAPGERLLARVNGVVRFSELVQGTETLQWNKDGNPIEGAVHSSLLLTDKDQGSEITLSYSFQTRDGVFHTLTSKPEKVPAAALADPIDAFLIYLYRKYLNRDPDPEGLAWWKWAFETIFKRSLA